MMDTPSSQSAVTVGLHDSPLSQSMARSEATRAPQPLTGVREPQCSKPAKMVAAPVICPQNRLPVSSGSIGP